MSNQVIPGASRRAAHRGYVGVIASLITFVFVWYSVPETHGKWLEEIQYSWENQ